MDECQTLLARNFSAFISNCKILTFIICNIMKNRFTIIVLAAFSLAPVSLTAQAQSARPQSVSRSNARFIRIVSPEVHADQTVTFRYLAPNATKVELSGQFLKKTCRLSKMTKGFGVL